MSESAEQGAQLVRDLQNIDFVEIALILVGTWLAIMVVRHTLPWLAERGPSQTRLILMGAVPVFRLLALIVAIVWITPLVIRVTLENFLVIAGAASVAIGFAFKDYVSSLIAGVVALFEKPWRPGDWVTVGDHYGEVQSVGMRALTLRTLHDDIITVPLLKLWDSNIVNANDGARTLMCVVDFYLHPDHDTAQMPQALKDVALTSAWLGYDRPVAVFVEQTRVGTHYELRAYPFEMRDQGPFRSDMTLRGKAAIRALGGMEISAPAAAG
ncbi:mechanosensitive ion channel protein MscS [Kushneria pakistanensis]|uniref:Small-conductance mechanosensitive channel n=1 Tax=Kushneria pakistanensis TaxID=1508770 RepID=A0ABQ3FGY6_9GAMM|nr:mechanosensitive ion channel domain-containing protein [Kushneria pakistanensis]GHC23620.1 mechanosensitive ion channel protein MscS [Kushneria pakistanensis]